MTPEVTCRDHEEEANLQYELLHSDVAGAELIELPPGISVPHLCNIVLMRGSIFFSSSSGKMPDGSLQATADSRDVRSFCWQYCFVISCVFYDYVTITYSVPQ